MGTAMRMGTGQIGGGEDGRPMTSNQGAGYSSSQPRRGFNPGVQGGGVRSSTAILQKKSESSPQEACRDLERKVHVLLEESAQAMVSNDVGGAPAWGCGAAQLLESLSPFLVKMRDEA